MNSVKANIKAAELLVTANFDTGRKCIFSLQFTIGGRGRVQPFYRKTIPRFSLDLQISEKERGICLWKRTYCL